MSTAVSWPPIGGVSYSIPASNELNWASLSNFLIALGQKAQSIDNTKLSIRTATTTPVTVLSSTDCIVVTALSVAGAVAVTLPAGVTGQIFFIVDGTGDAATNAITITPNGGQLINGAATYIINKNRAGVLFGFNGTGWTVLAEFTNIAAGTIPRSSIAAGSANHVVINDGSGNLSSEAQLAKSRGGTGADNSSVTFPSTGVVTTDAGTSTLTNKSINADNNTITNLVVADLKTVVGNANKVVSFDGSGIPQAALVGLTSQVTGTLPLGNGGSGQVTASAAFDAFSPTTTKGDVITRNSTTNIRVAVGADGTVLTADSAQAAGIKWGTALANPMTTAGDIIVGGVAGAANRLAIGSTGQMLAVVAGAPTWQTGVLGQTSGTAVGATIVGAKLTASRALSSASALTSNTNLDITSLAITAGVWVIYAAVGLSVTAANAITNATFWLNTTSVTQPSTDAFAVQDANGVIMFRGTTATANDNFTMGFTPVYINISGTTTYYLSARVTFTSNVPSAYGGLVAVRIA